MTATCALCGEPMPAGEEMFKYHGYSGPCPKPPLDKGLGTQPERQEQSSGGVEPIEAEAARILRQAYGRLVTPDDDGSFYAVIREFPGCIATSDTASEALANLESVAESWLLAELDRGHNIPGPTPFEWPRGASRAAYALRPISGPDTRAALVEAREALGPFAAKAENYDGTWENIDGLDLPYEDDHDIGINVEVGNVRHARSALASIDRVLSSPPTAEPLAEETTVLWRKRHGCSEPRIATSRERNRDVGGAP